MATVPRHAAEYAPGSVGDVLRLVRSGEATSRSAIARVTGLAPSTVSIRVDALRALRLVRESGSVDSRGGRRARRLELDGSAGFVAAVDLGAHHARIVLSDLAGTIVADAEPPQLTAQTGGDGPAAVVDSLWEQILKLATEHGLDEARLSGAAIGVPAPVSRSTGRIVHPSFRPSWHDADLPALFATRTDVPVLVENDVNLIALAERPDTSPADDQQIVAVKLGTRIGAGIIAGGRLLRGIGGAAGEFGHSAVGETASVGCTCGVPDCLEAVAGGGAMAARLQRAGYPVGSTSELLVLGAQGDPRVVEELRNSGIRIGRVLAGVANFFNPREIVLAGTLSASPPLVAALRGEVYRTCLPLVADDLDVRVSRNARDATVRGAIVLALDEVLAPARIDRLAHRTLG